MSGGSVGYHQRVEREIEEEKAASLRRILEKLDLALARVRALDALVSEAEGALRDRLVSERESARRLAGGVLWLAIVQRESLGLLQHAELLEACGIPRALIVPSATP